MSRHVDIYRTTEIATPGMVISPGFTEGWGERERKGREEKGKEGKGKDGKGREGKGREGRKEGRKEKNYPHITLEANNHPLSPNLLIYRI